MCRSGRWGCQSGHPEPLDGAALDTQRRSRIMSMLSWMCGEQLLSVSSHVTSRPRSATSSRVSARVTDRGHTESCGACTPATCAPTSRPTMQLAMARPELLASLVPAVPAERPNRTMLPVITLGNTPPRARNPVASAQPVRRSESRRASVADDAAWRRTGRLESPPGATLSDGFSTRLVLAEGAGAAE